VTRVVWPDPRGNPKKRKRHRKGTEDIRGDKKTEEVGGELLTGGN